MVVPKERKRLRQDLALKQFLVGQLPLPDPKGRFRRNNKLSGPLGLDGSNLEKILFHQIRLAELRKQKPPKL